MNPKMSFPNTQRVRILEQRFEIISAIREFFKNKKFIEVETPLLVVNPGLEPHLIPFETRLERGMGITEEKTLYLPTSPEYHLKKALALGIPRVFELSRSFRNQELGRFHQPEFTMLEWYRCPGNYKEIAEDLTQLLSVLGKQFSPQSPWNEITHCSLPKLFEEFCGISLLDSLESQSLSTHARQKNLRSIAATDDDETTFHKLLLEYIEPQLGLYGPTFVWDYPAQFAALSRIQPENPKLCERFEVYWKGSELANAFGELTDPKEQRVRCLKDQSLRQKFYGKTPPLDEDFLTALGALPGPAGGIALGVDRLVQCLLGVSSVEEVIAFPHSSSL
jgi:lysyl-tRNA synthetase class 2